MEHFAQHVTFIKLQTQEPRKRTSIIYRRVKVTIFSNILSGSYGTLCWNTGNSRWTNDVAHGPGWVSLLQVDALLC